MEYLPLITCIVIEFYYGKHVNGWIWLIVVFLSFMPASPFVRHVYKKDL